MRPLSPIELRGLVDMVTDPGRTICDDDPIEEAWDACVERGLATYRDEGECKVWEMNELGRLALRVHQAVIAWSP